MPDSTALTIPADIRKALLESQTRQVEGNIKFPTVRVMAQGVGMFEFSDSDDRPKEFQGILLGSHPRNVLWDKKMNPNEPRTEEDKFPACSSPDGLFGRPREGFVHKALGRAATGEELIDCRTCPYNQWGTGNLLIPDRAAKGKAVTNQRSVYVAIAGRLLPVELQLTATSIPEFESYLGRLLNRGKPMQAVLTKFSQTIRPRGGLKWGIVKFEAIEDLGQETFEWAIQMMERFDSTLNPKPNQVAEAKVETETTPLNPSATTDGDDEELPF